MTRQFDVTTSFLMKSPFLQNYIFKDKKWSPVEIWISMNVITFLNFVFDSICGWCLKYYAITWPQIYVFTTVYQLL